MCVVMFVVMMMVVVVLIVMIMIMVIFLCTFSIYNTLNPGNISSMLANKCKCKLKQGNNKEIW
jgi:hypothetical protein